jgi:carboxylesterase type B
MSYQEESYRFDAGPLGHIEGLTLSLGNEPAVRYFGGIPYALPPTGEYRFRAPRKLPKGYRYGTAANVGRFTGGTGVCPQPPCRNPPPEALFDENCLQLNIWSPVGAAPKGGWPVCFYLHGGFLQWGSANWVPSTLAPLLHQSSFRAIMVLPAFRLNALGFLTGQELAAEAERNGEPVGNMGLWDQRLALEWTHANISCFGGDHANITVAGYSAGGFSAFQQLAHELYRIPASERIIRRIAMLSNGPGVPPKTLTEQQSQFNEYISRLGIPLDLQPEEKLERLRSLPYAKLIEVQKDMKIHEFRLLGDGQFLPKDLTSTLANGDFGNKMREGNIRLLSGECKDEHTIYRTWRTPGNSYIAVRARLCAEYPEGAADKLMAHYCQGRDSRGEEELPPAYADWETLFGHISADVQVHAMQRGFHDMLFRSGLVPGVDVLRYRIERRLGCVDESIPPEWGVTHSSDIPIWFWGANFEGGLTDREKVWLKGWNEGFAAFVGGDHEQQQQQQFEWGPSMPREMRRWRSDGETDVWEDEYWEKGIELWNLLYKS